MDKNLKFIKIINRVNAYYFVTKKLMWYFLNYSYVKVTQFEFNKILTQIVYFNTTYDNF